MKSFLCLTIIWFCLGFIYQTIADECISRGPCSCIYEDGTGYDLSQLATTEKRKYLESQPVNETVYLFSPCRDITEVPANVNNTKNDTYAVAFVSRTANSLTVLGKSNESFIKILSDTRIYLIYKQEKNITTVRLACANINEDHLYAYTIKSDDNQTNSTDLILYSKHGCRVQLETNEGMSFGSLLLVALFIIVFGYLCIGIALKYFLVGARGIEVIPNISFWRRFPTIVRERVNYICSGCRSPSSDNLTRSSPNQDSYISI